MMAVSMKEDRVFRVRHRPENGSYLILARVAHDRKYYLTVKRGKMILLIAVPDNAVDIPDEHNVFTITEFSDYRIPSSKLGIPEEIKAILAEPFMEQRAVVEGTLGVTYET